MQSDNPEPPHIDPPPNFPRRGRPPLDRSSRDAQASVKHEGTGRQRRKKFTALQQKGDVPIPGGLVGRWVNDAPGRIQHMLDLGYEFVESKETQTFHDAKALPGEQGQRVNHVADMTTGQRRYLMATPQDYYDEDQAAKKEHNDKIMAPLRKGQMGRKEGDGRYSPEEIKRKNLVRISDRPFDENEDGT